MPEKKKVKSIVYSPRKKQFYLRYCHSFVTKTSKLQAYHNNFSSKLRLNLAWVCTGALIFLDISWFVKLYTLGKVASQFANWSISSFLRPYKSRLPVTPVLTTRIIRALPLRRHCRIFIAETQTCLQALSLLRAYTTHYTVQWVHTFLVVTPQLNFESSIPQILLVTECGRLIQHLSQKFCKCVPEKME